MPTVSKVAIPLSDDNNPPRGHHLCAALRLMNGFRTEALDEEEEEVECYSECKVHYLRL